MMSIEKYLKEKLTASDVLCDCKDTTEQKFYHTFETK